MSKEEVKMLADLLDQATAPVPIDPDVPPGAFDIAMRSMANAYAFIELLDERGYRVVHK